MHCLSSCVRESESPDLFACLVEKNKVIKNATLCLGWKYLLCNGMFVRDRYVTFPGAASLKVTCSC